VSVGRAGLVQLGVTGVPGPPGEGAARATQDCRPQLLRVGEEGVRDQVAGRNHGPRSAVKLVVELAGRPSGVPGVDAQRPQVRHEGVGGDVEIDDAERADHPTETFRLLRIAHKRVERRQAQCTVEGNRASLEKVRCPGEVVAPPRQHGCDIERRGLIEYDAEGAGLVMLDEEDDCLMEGLFEIGRGDEEQSGLRRIRWATDRGGLEHRAIVARGDAVRETLGGMTTIALTEETFAPTVQGSPIVLVDFWAAWCGPCRQFGPVFEKVSDAHADIVFAKVDTEAEPGLAQVFQISSIPTLMAIRDGVVLYSQAGALPEQGLEQLIQAIRDVDMDDVRASIAEEQAGQPAE